MRAGAALLALAIVSCAAPEDPQVVRGRVLFAELGCAACHRADARATAPTVGPSLAGVYGREEQLADGTRLRVDDGYLRESITQPDARTVAGFERGVMQAGLGASRERLRDPALVDALMSYLRSLR